MILLDGYRDTLPADPARGRVLFDESSGGIAVSFRQRGDTRDAQVYVYPDPPTNPTALSVGRMRGPLPWHAQQHDHRDLSLGEWRRAWALFVDRCRREGMRLDYRRAVAR